MITVLVTGAGALLGQGIIRALQASTLDVRIVTADPSPLSAGLYWGDRGHLILPAADPDYLDRLSEVMDLERPDVVMVGTDVELMVLATHRAELEARHGTHILVSDPRVVGIADDKYRTFEFFRDAGGAPPASALPENADELEAVIEAVGFPLIVKPRMGARSIGVSRVNDRSELAAALAGREGLVVQECVGTDATEYTAGVIVFDGKADAAIVMRRDLRDGNTYRAFVDLDPGLHEAVLAFGEQLKPYGPANFQFRLDAAGRPRVFEINGRFSGTTPLRALAGFNEVEMCVRRILDGTPVTQPKLGPLTILRHWSETVVQDGELVRPA
ncbi:MAG TPA: ATP-grasp domain-containing protein [Brevundimonas sp.]|jgi:carbamoyl-phosphate synthase large subunit|uniref:ATP-grasp domain-containing protein n=1 Tax=Brevundimonas sp. TaxID=1871086 RepID=UPI002DF6611E|nr:ATP-grasp domain-containing protein [Brevundimonas sp.]